MTEQQLPPEPRRSVEATAIDIAIRLGLLGLFAYWSLSVVAPFLGIVLWAVILAVAIYPAHRWLAEHLGGRQRLASALITVLGLAVILGPAAALAVSLFDSVQSLTAGLKDGSLKVPAAPEAVRVWPVVGETIYQFWSQAVTNLEGLILANKSFILSTGGHLLAQVAGAAGSVLAIGISVIIAGLLYSHGPSLAASLRAVATRIVAERGEEFVELAGSTIRNVSRGVIGVAILQSLLAGIGLLMVGIPAAGLLTFAVLVLCVVQVGPGLVLVPVTIWAWTQFDALTALAFTVYVVPVTLLDNVLKPIVMARGLRTPMLVILIGVLGGTLSHGLVGLFLGPVVLAVFYELFTAWVKVGLPGAERGAPDQTAKSHTESG